MIKKINFTKMAASGNDFVIIEKNNLSAIRYPLPAIAKMICDRRFGIGADGLLLLEESKKADARMRIFNADGSEAEMCGNGARCLALYSAREQRTENREQKKIKIETKAGIIEAVITNIDNACPVRKNQIDKIKFSNGVKIKLTNPKDIKTEIPLKVNGRNIKVDFINTGVPHTVVFVEGLEKIDVFNLGRAIRYHSKFKPAGTNVNFVEVINKDFIRVRTYERGVENETLACGTGSSASALIFALKSGAHGKIYVHTQSGEILTVYFTCMENKLENVWLEGKANIVYEGIYNMV